MSNKAVWADFVALDPETQVQRALSVMSKVVDEAGRDHVYVKPDVLTGCRYVHGIGSSQQPGCLIGHVLHRLGLSLADLHATDEGGPDGGEDAAITDYGSRLGLHPVTVDVLAEAQGVQDDGTPWGGAYDDALARLARLTGMAVTS